MLPEESPAELRALAEHRFPFVIVDPRVEVPDGIPVVCAAHSSGATQATRRLLSLGHRRIGAICGPRGWVATQERLRGFYAALAGAGVLPGSFLNVSNYQADPSLIDYGTWISDCIAMVTDPANAYYNNPAAAAASTTPPPNRTSAPGT